MDPFGSSVQFEPSIKPLHSKPKWVYCATLFPANCPWFPCCPSAPTMTISIIAAEFTRTSIDEWNRRRVRYATRSGSDATAAHSTSANGNITATARASWLSSAESESLAAANTTSRRTSRALSDEMTERFLSESRASPLSRLRAERRVGVGAESEEAWARRERTLAGSAGFLGVGIRSTPKERLATHQSRRGVSWWWFAEGVRRRSSDRGYERAQSRAVASHTWWLRRRRNDRPLRW
ncbi:hypothetical protein TIFTF001_021103 [Ficus carica]|uniref:Uncharacterized protein n=1 Tax=Ficus carica TaxID=3494 RepID=A0AA88AUN2_FICCA|nr:hypothetical protein TIFTF001_021103 [Ficus carica]